MFVFPFYPYHQQRLKTLSEHDRENRHTLRQAESDVESLEHRLDRLTLACAAMWSLLKQHDHTEAELLERMEALDLRDGKLDGKLEPGAVECAGCGRKSKGDRRSCLFCGAALPKGPAFGIEP